MQTAVWLIAWQIAVAVCRAAVARALAQGSFNTHKIAVSAVATALASVCIILTNIIPLRVTLLFLSAGCYYLAFYRTGLIYGFLTIAASTLIAFFVFPMSAAFFLTVIFFAPYSVIAYFLRNIYYTDIKSAAIRISVTAVFAGISFYIIYLCAEFVTSFDISGVIGKYGFALAIIIFIAVAVASDALLYQLMKRIQKLVFKNA